MRATSTPFHCSRKAVMLPEWTEALWRPKEGKGSGITLGGQKTNPGNNIVDLILHQV